MAKKKIKEDVSDDIGKAKALKRKTRKVLKNPEKAGEVADELSDGAIDAPEKKVEPTNEEPDVKNDVEATDGGDVDAGANPDVDSEGDAEDAADGMDTEETPDLGTFLERAIANSKDAIAKYEKHLAELKEKVKSMGLEVPGLLDPEDVSDEQTPEEFPPDIDIGDPDTDGDTADTGVDAEGSGDEGGDSEPPPPGDDNGDEANSEPPPPSEDGCDTSEQQNVQKSSGPKPTKEVEGSIAAPAPTNGTKLR